VPINFEYWQRDILQRAADERRITMQEMLYRFIATGLIRPKDGYDMYDAVLDGAYDR
jgi:hypothetical protein